LAWLKHFDVFCFVCFLTASHENLFLVSSFLADCFLSQNRRHQTSVTVIISRGFSAPLKHFISISTQTISIQLLFFLKNSPGASFKTTVFVGVYNTLKCHQTKDTDHRYCIVEDFRMRFS